MPSVSPAQHRFMEMVAHDPAAAHRVGVPQSVGQEFVVADKRAADGGREKSPSQTPEPAATPGSVDDLGNPITFQPPRLHHFMDNDPNDFGDDPTAPVWRGPGRIGEPYKLPILNFDSGGYYDPGVEMPHPALQRTASGGGIVPRHYDTGGPTGTGIATVTPSSQMMNPTTQGMMQRYGNLSPEQLQETAVRLRGSPQGALVQRMLQQKQMMPNVGAPSQTDSTPPQGYAFGGAMGMSEASPWWERSEERGALIGSNHTGFINSAVPGRTDQHNLSPPGGSYVLPADVVSGLGEGNSLAGARIMTEALSTGPFGTPMPRGRVGRGPPPPPRPPPQEARGGRQQATVPIVAAGGEMILSPEQVLAIGHGDMKRGHDALDKFVVHVRQKTAKTMLKLPGPKKT